MLDSTVFAKNLKEARKRAGLTQMGLAEAVDLSMQSISGYENGNLPSLETLVSIAEKLNVSLDDLCGLTKNESAKQEAIETETEAIEALYKLHQYLGGTLDENGLHVDLIVGTNEEEVKAAAAEGYCTSLAFFGHYHVRHFLEGYSKLVPLLEQGLINKTVFDSWYKGELKESESPVELFDD